MTSEHNVTLADIAKAARCSAQTVSLALRGQVKIPGPTRARIQKIAKSLGYRPDPMLSALHRYRKRIRQPKYQSTLAYVTAYPLRKGFLDHPMERGYYEGALSRSNELGYLLETFWLKEPGMNEVRFSKILQSRGISGILIAPLPTPNTPINLEWNNFSVVGFGYTAAVSDIHRVMSDIFQGTSLAWDKCFELGYRRPGLYVAESTNLRNNQIYTAVFSERQKSISKENRVPLKLVQTWDPKEFLSWVCNERPDCILIQTREPIASIKRALAQRGIRVPKDIGLINLNWADEKGTEAGIRTSAKSIGAVAVDLLAGKIQCSIRGLSRPVLRTMVLGVWKSGDTVRRQTL